MLALAAARPRVSVDRAAPFLWYTLSVIPQSQARVCQRAKELGIETYVPMSRTPPMVRKFGRQRVTVAEVRPLMPGYVFVSLPTMSPEFSKLQSPRNGKDGVRGAVGYLCGPDGPMPVSEAVIEDMRIRERNGEFDLTTKTDSGRGFVARWVKRGATVNFVDGPFKFYFGVIDEVLSSTLVKVGVSVFGRITVFLAPLDWIRRVA